ncbi:hypothetical protein FJZ53_06055 [Candidatus Woesearchaeota archaeon]|nr:hypothetical protein [Candidatus Woesearchaeota archaeon]
MESDKATLSILIMLAVAGFVLLGNGFTGLVVFDSTTGEICSSNDDCKSQLNCVGNDCKPVQVCCMFYGEEQGVCHEPEACSLVTKLTKEEKEDKNAAMLASSVKSGSDKLKGNYLAQAFLGGFILVLSFILIYYQRAHQHHKVVHKKKKHAHS